MHDAVVGNSKGRTEEAETTDPGERKSLSWTPRVQRTILTLSRAPVASLARKTGSFSWFSLSHPLTARFFGEVRFVALSPSVCLAVRLSIRLPVYVSEMLHLPWNGCRFYIRRVWVKRRRMVNYRESRRNTKSRAAKSHIRSFASSSIDSLLNAYYFFIIAYRVSFTYYNLPYLSLYMYLYLVLPPFIYLNQQRFRILDATYQILHYLILCGGTYYTLARSLYVAPYFRNHAPYITC